MAVHLRGGPVGIYIHAGRGQQVYANARGQARHCAAKGEAGAVERIHITADLRLIGDAVHHGDHAVIAAQDADGIAAVGDAAYVDDAGIAGLGGLLRAGEGNDVAVGVRWRHLGLRLLLGLLMLRGAAMARRNVGIVHILLRLRRTVALLEGILLGILCRLLGLRLLIRLRLGRLVRILIRRLRLLLRIGLLIGLRLRLEGRFGHDFRLRSGFFCLRLLFLRAVEKGIIRAEETLRTLPKILESHGYLLILHEERA